MRLTVVRIVLDHSFEGCNGVLGTSATDLHLAAIDQRVIVARIRLQNLGVEPARLLKLTFLQEKLDVIFLQMQVRLMLSNKGSVFGKSFVQVARREVEICQHAIADWVVGKIVLCLFCKVFRSVFLAFHQVQMHECRSWFRAAWSDFDRSFELLFGFAQAAARLIKTTQ